MTCEPNEEWYLKKAESEIQENKLEDAKLTLREAQIVCSSDRITSLLASVLEQQASLNAGITVVGSKENFMRYTDSTKKAFETLEKARKWLVFYTENAQELLAEVEATIATLHVTDEIQIMIPEAGLDAGCDAHEDNSTAELRTEQNRARTPLEPPPKRTVHSENVEEARMYVDKANESNKMGDFDKAEHFLLKAKRMDSSIDVEEDLKQVRDAIAARNTKSSESAAHKEVLHESESPRPEQTSLYIDEANTYLEIAKNAYNDKNYDRALVFLNKADELYSSEHASNLRKKVKYELPKPKKSFAEVCVSSTTGRSSKPTSNKKNVLSATLTQKDINHVKFNEAEKKLQTSGTQRAKKNNMLEREPTKPQIMEAKVPVESKKQVESKVTTVEPATQEVCLKPEELVRPEESVKSVNSVEPEKVVKLQEYTEPEKVLELKESVDHSEVEKLEDIHANDANTCIHEAEKAYYDGELEKAERLLKKAERLYPSETAQMLLETVNIAIKEKNKMKVQAPENNTPKPTEYSVVNELTKREEKLKQFQPNDISLDQKVQKNMLRASVIKVDKVTANKKNSTPESKGGTSMKTQNRENVKSTSDPDSRVLENKNTGRLQEEYKSDMSTKVDILKNYYVKNKILQITIVHSL